MQINHFQHRCDIIFRRRFAHSTATRFPITRERSHCFRQQRALFVSLTGHDRSDGATKRATFHAVIAVAIAHHERAEVSVTEPERAKDMRILRDFFDGVAGVIDNNFLRGNEDAHRRFEAFDIKHAIRFFELHQIKRSQIAGGVIEEKVLTAWISRILPACSFAGMPFVYGGIELHPGIAADVSSFRDFAEQCPRIFAFAWRTVTHPPGPPFPVFQRRVHEFVAHTHA